MPEHIIHPTVPAEDRAAYEAAHAEAAAPPSSPPPPPPAPPAAHAAPTPRAPVPEIGQQVVSENPLEEIERLVAARGEAQAHVQRPSGNLTFNTATGEVRLNGEPADAAALAAADPIVDTGAELRENHARAVAKFNAMLDEFNEVTGYDANGQPLYRISDPATRANMLRRIDQMETSLRYQAQVYGQIEAQRAEKAAAAERARNADNAMRLWAGGDAARLAMVKEEIDREEARRIAVGIVDSRRSKP